MNQENERKFVQVQVVIIGAGAAGLQCATSLQESDDSISFVVLEARNRIGGRIFTNQETRSQIGSSEKVQFCRDYGASWVHGIGHLKDRNPVVRLLEGKEDTLSPIFTGNPWTRPDTILHKQDKLALYVNKALVANDSPVITKAIRRHYDLQNKISHYVNHLYETGNGMDTATCSLQEIRNKLLKQEEIQERQDDDDDDDLVEQIYPFYNFLLENWHGQSSKDLQLGLVADESYTVNGVRQTDELYIPEGDFTGPHCKIKGGMISVFKPLIDKLDGKIRMNETVTKVTKIINNVVQVETSSGLIVQAECCICTIPLGCLQAYEKTLFYPRLSYDKRKAIQSISSGFYKKVFLEFDRIFWPIEKPLMGLIRRETDGGLGKYLLVNNLWAKYGIPCLEVILCGYLGKLVTNKTDEFVKNYVLDFLQDSMDSNVRDFCIEVHITKWEEDPLTMGSYSSFQLETLERHIEEVCSPEWEGRLLFAGEFTDSEYMGSVHAAILSGERASDHALSVCLH